MLELREVSKHYRSRDGGTVRALDGVSLAVRAGEFAVVRGPSGSGKTTLLLACGSLLPPGSGTVSLSGRDVYALDPSSRAVLRAADIGFVFQQFYLIPYLSVLENVLTPSLASVADSPEDRARKLLGDFGLSARLGHLPSELSTGERQRVGLARALLNRPSLLLADEPTGNLDHDNSRMVLDSLAGFAESGGAVLMVTHDREAAARADTVWELVGGKIDHSGKEPDR